MIVVAAQAVCECAARVGSLSLEQVQGPGRQGRTGEWPEQVRQAAIWVCRERLHAPVPIIAEVIGMNPAGVYRILKLVPGRRHLRDLIARIERACEQAGIAAR